MMNLIRLLLSLSLSLQLASPALAQTQSGAASGAGAGGSAVAAAAAGAAQGPGLSLAPGLGLGSPAARVDFVASFLAADLKGLSAQPPAATAKALAGALAFTGAEGSESTLAALNQSRSLIRSAVASPKVTLSPAGLAALSASFGPSVASRLQELSRKINEAAAQDPAVRKDLQSLRRQRALDQEVLRKVLIGALVTAGKLKAVFVDQGPAVEGALKGSPSGALKGSPTGEAKASGPSALSPAVVKETAAKPPVAAPVALAPSAPAKRPSTFWRRTKQAVLGLAIVGSFLSSDIALAQNRALDVTPPANRPAATAQAEAPDAQAVQRGYVQARDINDVLARYDKDVKLYVIGDIQGLGSSEYRDLARFLSDKHWVVVLVEDASGNRYVDAEGRTHYDDDAVDYGTGQGIARKSGFKALVNAETGEEDGAILTLVMRQRALFLHTSKAHDNRGMNGETQFKGNLDRWAVSNLKNGGNIEGAIRESVENIDSRLAQAIASEAQGARGAVAEAKRQIAALESTVAAFNAAHPQMAGTLGRHDVAALKAAAAKAESALSSKDYSAAASGAQRVGAQAGQALSGMQAFEASFASAKSELAAAKADVSQLEKAAAAFRSDFPRVTGPLARPETKALSETLAKAEKESATNPAQAAAAAQAVRSQVKANANAIAEYPAGKQLLDAADVRLSELSGAKRASSGAVELAQAKTALGEAKDLYETGGVDWNAKLQEANGRLKDGAQAIAEADAQAQRNLIILLVSLLAGLLGSLGTGIFLRRRVKPVQAETEQLLTDWTTALDTKLETLIDELDGRMSRYIGPATGEAAGKYVGETARLAVQAREDIGNLHIIWGGALIILNQAKALAYPSNPFKKLFNYFFPGKYREAVALLKDTPVTFKPQDGVEAALGDRSKSWDEKLLGDITSYKPFSKSFNELMKEFHERATRATAAVKVVEESILTAGPKLQAVEEGIAAAEAQKAAIDAAGASDGLFLVPSVFTETLPAAKAAAAQATEQVKTDPVGGLQGQGAVATRLADDAKLLLSTIADARAGALVTVESASKALSAAGVATGWIETELNRLSGRAEALAVKAAQEPAAEKIKTFGSELAAFAAKAASAAELTKELVDSKANRIEKANVAIEAARMELGAKLGLEADKVMREADQDPSDLLAGASKQAAAAQKALGAGKLDEARKALDELARLSAEAKAIVDASKASVESHEKTVAARKTETARIEGLVGEHEGILAAISKKYAKSVLNLGAGDPSHPNGNGTVEDNIGETNSHLTDSKAKVEKAAKVFRDGKVLQAASLLAQVAAHQEGAVHRLNEVKEKQARLERAEAANAKTLTGLDERVATYAKEVDGDARTMKPTLAAYKKAKLELEEARQLARAAKGDPFKAEAALAAVVAAMDQVWVQARNDRDAHAEAERSLTAAYNAIQAAQGEARRAEGDGHGDSSETREAYAAIERAGAAYTKARGAFDVKHGDWNEIDREADQSANMAAQASATIRREMQEAENASQQITRAANKVREATNWSGSYGVYISGSPGSSALDSARTALRSGDYAGAVRYAQSAYSAADRAIDEAESEVASRRRAEEERQRREAAERRRREQEEEDRRNRSSGGGGGGFGGGGSGNGGGGWGGSSSGNGRSGW